MNDNLLSLFPNVINILTTIKVDISSQEMNKLITKILSNLNNKSKKEMIRKSKSYCMIKLILIDLEERKQLSN